MNLKDKCKEDGITLTEGKERYGLTHWKQEVVEADDISCPSSFPVAIEAAEEVLSPIIEALDGKCLLETARAMQTGIGFKTPAYLQFVFDNKELLPAEYECVATLIERFICVK